MSDIKIREIHKQMSNDQTIIRTQALLGNIIANSLPEKIIASEKDVQIIYNKKTQEKIDEIKNFLKEYATSKYMSSKERSFLE